MVCENKVNGSHPDTDTASNQTKFIFPAKLHVSLVNIKRFKEDPAPTMLNVKKWKLNLNVISNPLTLVKDGQNCNYTKYY